MSDAENVLAVLREKRDRARELADAAPELRDALRDVLDALGAISKWWELTGYGISEERAKEIVAALAKVS